MTLVPFTLERFADIRLQPEQRRDTFDLTVPQIGEAYAIEIDGHCIGCGGLYPVTADVACAWAFIGEDAGPYFVRMVRAMSEVLERAHWRVVRAGVLSGFAPGHRLLAMLGFQPVGAAVFYGARVYNVFEYTNHVD